MRSNAAREIVGSLVTEIWRKMCHGQQDAAFLAAQRFSSTVSRSEADAVLSKLPARRLHGQTVEEWMSILFAVDQIDFLNRAGASVWSADHYRSALVFFARAASAGSSQGAWFSANALLWLGHVEESVAKLEQIARSGNGYAIAASGLLAFERLHAGHVDPLVIQDLISARTDATSHRVPGDLSDQEYADAIARAVRAL